MATSDPISWPHLNTSAGFHIETKYILLKYLGLPPDKRSQTPTDQGDVQREERTRKTEEELRQLEEEYSALFPSRGSDINPSPVFSLTNPGDSVEDCLATSGDKVTQDLGTHLTAAVQMLLSRPLDYQRFRSTALDLSVQTQEGKVLVPLVLLQALQSKGQALTTLLQLGLRYLEEEEADYIIQQGGWCEVLGLEPEDQFFSAEDSNDICIIPEEQPSPPSPLLCTADNGSDQSSWQTESFPVSLAGHESWAQVGAMDPEDVKSLDSNEGVALAEERSENNSSNSDIVHVEREDTELLEGGDAGVTEESMISVLGTEIELAELRAEFGDQISVVPAPTGAESTPPASLVSLEPLVVETSASLSGEPSLMSSEPKLLLLQLEEDPTVPPPAEPKLPASSPVPAVEPEPEPESAAVPALVPSGVEVPVPAKETTTAPAEPEATSEPASDALQELKLITTPHQPEPQASAEPVTPVTAPRILRAPAVEITEAPDEAPAEVAPVACDEAQPGEASVEAPAEEEPEEPAAKLQTLLYGGAALVLLAAISFGLIFLRRRSN